MGVLDHEQQQWVLLLRFGTSGPSPSRAVVAAKLGISEETVEELERSTLRALRRAALKAAGLLKAGNA